MRRISRGALLVAGIFLAWSWLHDRPPINNPLQISEPVTASATDLPPAPARQDYSAPATHNAPTTATAPDTFAVEFKKCFPDSRLAPVSPDDWLEQAERASEIDSRKITLQNLHIRVSSGVERRLQIAPINQQIEIREFAVDSESLPIPGGPLRLAPSDETVQVRDDFLSQGEKIYDQRKEVLRFKDGAYADLDWENDKVHDIKFFHNKISFYCRMNDCICKSSTSLD